MAQEGLFVLSCVDQKYYEADLVRIFGLNYREPIADGYGHFDNYTWFVQEVEGSDIDWAVKQVKSIVEQLERNGRRVDKIFIVVTGAFKSKQYESRNKVLYIRGAKNPYQIRGKVIRIVRPQEIKEELAWQFC